MTYSQRRQSHLRHVFLYILLEPQYLCYCCFEKENDTRRYLYNRGQKCWGSYKILFKSFNSQIKPPHLMLSYVTLALKHDKQLLQPSNIEWGEQGTICQKKTAVICQSMRRAGMKSCKATKCPKDF